MIRKPFAKSVSLLLLDGVSSGRVSCELSNWAGKCYRIPRELIKISSDRKEIFSQGVYLLISNSEDDNSVYVGEAENIFERLLSHISEKKKWNEVIVFIRKDKNLNKAHIKYLEREIYLLLQENKVTLLNSNVPAKSGISENDIAEMTEYLSNLKLIVSVLGYKFFKQETIQFESSGNSQNYFYIKSKRGANAVGIPVPKGFLVFKNSILSSEITNSFQPAYRKFRQKLSDDGIVVSNSGKLKFNQDYLFDSPSYAASIILGMSANGYIEWKNDQNQTLKEHTKKDE